MATESTTITEPQYWLFQYRPKDRVALRLEETRQDEPVLWRITRFKDQIRVGDVFYVWRAFLDEHRRKENREASGIVAWGYIEKLEFEEHESVSKKGGTELRLPAKVNSWIDPPIPRDEVAKSVSPQRFNFLKLSRDAIFQIPVDVAGDLNRLIAERRVPVPAAPLPEAPDVLSNETIINTDHPAASDKLNRMAFAKALGVWLCRLWEDLNTTSPEDSSVSVNNKKSQSRGDSFVVHLYGRWGSGKTTFIGQLDKVLQEAEVKVPQPGIGKSPWVTVHFNAWRNQHVDPPWWGLLDRIIIDGTALSPKSRFLRLKERLWRYFYGYGLALVTGLGLVLVGVLIYSLSKVSAFTEAGALLQTVGTVVGTLGALGGALLLTLRSVFSGSATSARLFQRLVSDPMRKVRDHYQHTVGAFCRPVMVFIDDLDRCNADYVVGLLESLHTLYSDSRVFFVVAAEREWISACFEDRYETFGGKVAGPDQPTGYRFLEKLFQLSLGLPPVSPELKRIFLDEVTTPRTNNGSSPPTTASPDFHHAVERAAKTEFAEVTDESELNAKLRESSGDALQDQARVAAAILKSSHSEIFEHANRHRLTQFVDLMDSNPRSIKLVVNAFGIYVNLARVAGVRYMDEEFLDQVALWTLLMVRYPRVAEYLERFPQNMDVFKRDSITPEEAESLCIPERLISLIGDAQLRRIFAGTTAADGSEVPSLSYDTVAILVGQRAWRQVQPIV